MGRLILINSHELVDWPGVHGWFTTPGAANDALSSLTHNLAAGPAWHGNSVGWAYSRAGLKSHGSALLRLQNTKIRLQLQTLQASRLVIILLRCSSRKAMRGELAHNVTLLYQAGYGRFTRDTPKPACV
jgi:hypothetical protein